MSKATVDVKTAPPPTDGKTLADYLKDVPHDILVEAIAEQMKNAIGSQAKRWVAQSPQTPLAQVLEWIREEKAAGVFDRKNWDHHSPSYRTGRSNKLVKMWAAMVSGDGQLTMDESWDLVESLAAHQVTTANLEARADA